MAETSEQPAGGPTARMAAAWEARRLLRAGRVGSFATAAAGQPFAALVTPATAPDLSLLVLLSGLSEHTRQLRADPRCALLIAGAPTDINPQTAPRVTVCGSATLSEDQALKARWLARHPYAAFYAGFADFSLWRLPVAEAHYVGGFARAFRLSAADLAPDPAAVAAVQEAETAILTHCNDDHADALGAIAREAGGTPGTWRMVATDVDGCDLALDDEVLRIPWSAPVAGPQQIRQELVRLAAAARSSDAARGDQDVRSG